MREFLFRGKAKINDGELIVGQAIFGGDKVFIIETDKGFPHPIPEGSRTIEVDPKSLQQYSGIDDVDGVKLFEGDACTHNGKYEGSDIVDIVFLDGAFCTQSREKIPNKSTDAATIRDSMFNAIKRNTTLKLKLHKPKKKKKLPFDDV